MKNTVIGILAHVDAGKTTLSESILFQTGTIRQHGRVDHGDAFLDTDEMEKKRGITIYSKLARFQTGGRPFIILDTPGHADFSPEMERALRVMDAAVLVISAADVISQKGADPQVRTLWRLLDHYQVPTFLFINKMDQQTDSDSADHSNAVRDKIFHLLTHDLGQKLVIFGSEQLSPSNEETIAALSDDLIEKVLEGEAITDHNVTALIAERKLFPVYFGSALRDEGTADLLEGLRRYAVPKGSFSGALPSAHHSDNHNLSSPGTDPHVLSGSSPTGRNAGADDSASLFGAIVYKITHEDGVRLSWMKITSGSLSVRDSITERRSSAVNETISTSTATRQSEIESDGGVNDPDDDKDDALLSVTEKISEIRLYSGDRYTRVTTASAGEIAAVTGLSYTQAGDGLGVESSNREELLTPIQTSRVTATDLYGKPVDDFTLMKALRGLEEQEPMLAASQDEVTHDITVRIMGPVQIEILKNLLHDRYHLRAEFGPGTIVYQETIRRPVEGVGHFEPLRHYAEVHLLLEPGDPGSGLIFENHCPPNTLDKNWQNLIMTHLTEKTHKGVLTGSSITDMKISLIGGRANKKHTSGGDFRKATYAAVRQGLMMAENILLEPVLSIRLELPVESIGRAMTDISSMHGRTQPAEFTNDNMAILEGFVPASELGDYAQTVSGYTGGRGHLDVSLKGYEPCHNAREVIDEIGYDPDLDRRNPTWSVFCSHGAGTVVPWDRVRDFMQLDTGWRPSAGEENVHYLTDDYFTFTSVNTDIFEIDRGEDDSSETSTETNLSNVGGQTRGGKKDHNARGKDARSFKERQNAYYAGEEELRRIFEATYGPIRQNLRHPENEKYYGTNLQELDTDFQKPDSASRNSNNDKKSGSDSSGSTSGRYHKKNHSIPQQEFLLVDGYNIIFAWEELKELAAADIKSARDRLLDILSDYAGYSGLAIIVVFDAYKVPGGQREVLRYHNIDVVYTKEAETADLYIEKTAHQLSKNHRVTVATGDLVEQVIIFGTGAIRLSPRGLLENIILATQDMRERFLSD